MANCHGELMAEGIVPDDPHVKDGYTEHPEYRFASCISEQFSTSKKGVTVEAGGDDAGAEAEGRPQPFRPPTLVGIEEDDLAEVEAKYKPKLKRSIQVEMRQRVRRSRSSTPGTAVLICDREYVGLGPVPPVQQC